MSKFFIDDTDGVKTFTHIFKPKTVYGYQNYSIDDDKEIIIIKDRNTICSIINYLNEKIYTIKICNKYIDVLDEGVINLIKHLESMISDFIIIGKCDIEELVSASDKIIRYKKMLVDKTHSHFAEMSHYGLPCNVKNANQ